MAPHFTSDSERLDVAIVGTDPGPIWPALQAFVPILIVSTAPADTVYLMSVEEIIRARGPLKPLSKAGELPSICSNLADGAKSAVNR